MSKVDVWMNRHSTHERYTGPLPRKNRLKYIFRSEDLYKECRYFRPRYGGDRLVQKRLCESDLILKTRIVNCILWLFGCYSACIIQTESVFGARTNTQNFEYLKIAGML